MTYVRTYPDRIENSVWTNLASAMSKEAGLMTERNTPEALSELYVKGLAVVLEHNGEMVGYLAAWPLDKGFIEVGSAWVGAEHRGNGFGSNLYAALHKLLVTRTEHAFAITQNPIAVIAGAHAHLELSGCWIDPIPWEYTCAPCEWVEEADKPECKHRNVTCMLRIMQR
jgi:predicted GNAT family acetyltransferase